MVWCLIKHRQRLRLPLPYLNTERVVLYICFHTSGYILEVYTLLVKLLIFWLSNEIHKELISLRFYFSELIISL